jgi:4-carboxymuconolactone decarboxylase
MNRIKDLSPEQMTPDQTRVFEELTAGRGRILTPYKVWIHSPTVASGMEKIGTFLNKRGSLSPREVEIGILIIARHWHADYVLQAHIREGKRVGLSDDVVSAICDGRDPPLTDPHERAVHDFARALAANAKPTDDEFAAFEKVLRREGVAEVLVLIGYYTSVALAMKAHDVPIPQQA